MEKDILLLGDERLYRPCVDVTTQELSCLRGLVEDMHDTLLAFRGRHYFADGITAPQVGVNKRLFYIHLDSPIVLINPIVFYPDDEKVEVMEGCLSFPGLMVKVMRYRNCVVRYRNLDWQRREALLQDDLSALVQHAMDHLEGVLSPMRAADGKAFYVRNS